MQPIPPATHGHFDFRFPSLHDISLGSSVVVVIILTIMASTSASTSSMVIEARTPKGYAGDSVGVFAILSTCTCRTINDSLT